MRLPATARAISTMVRPSTVTRPVDLLSSGWRFKSTSEHSSSEPQTVAVNPRWLSETKQRIGKCITFGLKPEQVQEAGRILHELARDWRELMAGSEGFLTGPHRRGLFRHRVVWGDSDSMV